VNVALIFAGGVGIRMNSLGKPKQFLELHGKPIILHTIEHFERHGDIDAICVVCVANWIGELKFLLRRYCVNKVILIAEGGNSPQESVYKGLKMMKESGMSEKNQILLVHDGVRPLIDERTISENIRAVREYGSAITMSSASETIAKIDGGGKITDISERSSFIIARAPQSFFFEDLLKAHERARSDGLDFIDSATLMFHYGFPLHAVQGPVQNVKITTALDYYIFRALYEAWENSQIFGI
jgi:2-C-methyl-D-erythritol 4-phosphate cytidylyltransferase